jgi:hypothetical protein
MKERSGMAWFRLGIRKLKEAKVGGVYGEGQMPLFAGEGSESHLLLKCPETQRWRAEFLKNKWPGINEAIALRKILTGNRFKELRNLGTLAYKIKCKWENQVKKAALRVGGKGRTRLYVGSIGYK